VTTSGRRSSDPSAALVYWGGSSSPTSLLITTSRASTYVDDRKHMRTTRIVVVPGRPHPLLSIRAKHQTTAIARLYQQLIQRLRDTRQEQDRVISTTTLYLPIVRASLSPHISLLDEWQSSSKRTQLSTLQPRTPRVQRNRLRDRRPGHRCIEYRQ